jgi:endoglycosylceramidase
MTKIDTSLHVYSFKISPWHPDVSGFDFENSLSSIDAKNLKSWGFNVVRLGIMWPGLEPGVRGEYNQTYLDQIDIIIQNLAENDVFVLLDLHQV